VPKLGRRAHRSPPPVLVYVEPVEVNSILADACAARNGWKVILGRCAPEKSRTVLVATR
jgi:hypothetical protein